MVVVLPKKSWLCALPSMPEWTIGSSARRWLKGQRTAKLAPWLADRADAAGAVARTATSAATAISVATTSVPALRVDHPILCSSSLARGHYPRAIPEPMQRIQPAALP